MTPNPFDDYFNSKNNFNKPQANFTNNTGFSTQNSGFGQPQQSNNTFGQTNNLFNQTQQNNSSFGQQPSAQTQQNTASFGQQPSAQTQQTTASFGQQPTAQAQQNTASFGQQPSARTQQTTASFGQQPSAQTQQNTASFGQQPSAQTQQTTASFGQQPSAQTQQTTASFGQLGSPKTMNAFGSQQTFNSTGNQFQQQSANQVDRRVNPFGPQPIFRSKNNTGNVSDSQTVNLFSQPNGFQLAQDHQQNIQNNNFINKITKKDSKEDDVSILLNNLYHSYIPESKHYKFNYIFYNIVEKPFNKPEGISDEIWKSLYINDRLMPVKLNMIQINERRKSQSELAVKIAESKYNLQQATEKLKSKREIAKSHFKNVLDKYREYALHFVKIDESDILNLRSSILNTNSALISYPSSPLSSTNLHNINRDKFYVKDKENCLELIKEIKKKLINLDKKIDEDLKKCEQRKFSLHNLLDNRI